MEQERHQEIRRLFQMLEQTAEIAEHAVLTETFTDGESRCITQFNKVLTRLNDINAVPTGLFDPLQTDATFSEITIACHHLAAYLSEDLGTAANFKGWVTNLLGKQVIENISDPFKEDRIGDLIRKSIPEFLMETILDDINETFIVSPTAVVSVKTALGTIDVQTAETDVVNVSIQRTAQLNLDRQAANMLKNFNVTFDQQDQELRIHTAFKDEKRQWKKVADRLDIHFEITVPQRLHQIILQTGGGDISVLNVHGKVQSRTAEGELQFENIPGTIFGHTARGNVRLTTCTGDVQVQTLRGDIDVNVNIGGSVNAEASGGNLQCTDVIGEISAETSGGNIQLSDCRGGANVHASGGDIEIENDGAITAKTVGGSIKADISGQPQEDSVLEAVGGDITVSLIPEAAVKIDAKSSGGKVTTGFPIAKVVQGPLQERQLQELVNGGGPLLALRNTGGDIYLKRRGD